MNLVFGEIELLIQGALFEQTGNPEKLEMEYEEKLKPMDEFEVEKGDEWKTKKGRIIFQERHRFMLKREVKVVFKLNKPSHFLQFKQYTDRKGAELKRGVSPDKLIHKLALEVNSYLTKPRMVEEIKDSISERERWGIKLTGKRADKKLSLLSNTRQNEKN